MIAGAIGSGKSVVGGMLARRGLRVVSADRLGHQVLDGEVLSKVAARWPRVIRDGSVDRSALADIVFSDLAELRELEGMVHPEVGRLLDEADQASAGDPLVVEMSVPHLVDRKGWSVVVIDTPVEVRRDRLRARGMDEHEIDRRMRAQPPRQQWLDLADFVIDNSGGLPQLEEGLDRLVGFLIANQP
jgi:dephospho-CoA kinase